MLARACIKTRPIFIVSPTAYFILHNLFSWCFSSFTVVLKGFISNPFVQVGKQCRCRQITGRLHNEGAFLQLDTVTGDMTAPLADDFLSIYLFVLQCVCGHTHAARSSISQLERQYFRQSDFRPCRHSNQLHKWQTSIMAT